MVYNTRYDESLWKYIREQTGPMQDVIKHTKASGLDLPPLLCGAQ